MCLEFSKILGFWVSTNEIHVLVEFILKPPIWILSTFIQQQPVYICSFLNLPIDQEEILFSRKAWPDAIILFWDQKKKKKTNTD